MAPPFQRIRPVLHGVDLRHPVLVTSRNTGGFTLLEAIVALTLSSLIVALVASVFWAQNDFYALVVERAKVHDNLRVVTDLIASEIRGVSSGGVTTAQPRQFIIRLPLAMGGVCVGEAGHGRVYMPGLSDINGSDVAGYARQDANGKWTYTTDTWSNLLVSSGVIDAGLCATGSGADTAGATQDFGRLLISGGTTLGEAIMIWQVVEFKIDESELDPTTLAVFRGVTGATLREFATGIKPDTKFEYSKGGADFTSSVTGAALDTIKAIRVTASAIASDSTGAVDAYEYEWTVKIPLRNSN